jgi:glutamate racemase
MTRNDAPVVVLDSGLGGLTVVQALHAAMPQERIVYFGDTARLPYGSKTPATVTLFVEQIIHYLEPLQPKHVVIACNTASALALDAVREYFPDLTITGVVEPGARAAVGAIPVGSPPTVGVLATEATVRSRAYVTAIQKLRPDAKIITRATPLLVPIIEEGRRLNDPLVQLCLEQYLAAILEQQPSALVLGCTHYPILRPLICQLVGTHVTVIDSAAQCAQDVREHLEERGLLRDASYDMLESIRPAGLPMMDVPAESWLQCYVTDDSPRFAMLASRFLGINVLPPELVSPDALFANATAETSR